jgi:single-stranded-DNA-specific exonuclease
MKNSVIDAAPQISKIPMMQRQWIFPSVDGSEGVKRLSNELSVPIFLARVLMRNGLEDFSAATGFLEPRLRHLQDPFLIPEMEAAVARLHHAIETREGIVLYGDYDVDGVASLALLQRILTAMGARVSCFLPLRAEDGYGLSPSGVERCFEQYSPELLVAVDCGTNSAREVAVIRQRGADVIVLDHHEVSSERPDCVALINPKTDGKFHYLCSAGVAFKVAHALLKRWPNPAIDLKNYLDIVALATLADLVPLVGENRILVYRGLQQMAHTRWPGLAALMTISNVRAPLRGSDIGFRLGPRINASGRLGTALESLRLLLCDDIREATQVADSLDRQNRTRQTVERDLILEVEQWVEEHYDAGSHASIVAGHREWHHGVLGIVAARVMRRHHRPTLLVGFDESGVGKGSGRSIEGLSLVDALRQCACHLEKFGGHEMAAGVTVHQDRFEEFRRAFEISARARVNDDILTPKLRLDAELPMEDVSLSLLDMQELLEPYGMGNAQPVFAARGVTPSSAPRVLKERHLRFDFRAGRRTIQAIYFRGAEEALPNPPWDIAFTLERNEFNGRVDAQMQVVGIRTAA